MGLEVFDRFETVPDRGYFKPVHPEKASQHLTFVRVVLDEQCSGSNPSRGFRAANQRRILTDTLNVFDQLVERILRIVMIARFGRPSPRS